MKKCFHIYLLNNRIIPDIFEILIFCLRIHIDCTNLKNNKTKMKYKVASYRIADTENDTNYQII